MDFNDDETLNLYAGESLEHLADIENDLLAMEEAGADIDEEVVNKVFRAAHSIKGGAGFMGLDNIKELGHKMENILGMIRNREMVPTPEIVNSLLLASDALRNLINNVRSSNEMDISEQLDALTSVTSNELPEEKKETLNKMVDISLPRGETIFSVAEYDIEQARKGGRFIYLVEYDLIHSVHEKDKTPLDVITNMEKSGMIVESKVDIKAVGTLDDENITNRIPFLVLFATILEPDMIHALFDVEEDCIYELTEDLVIRPVRESIKEEPVGFSEPDIALAIEEGPPEEPVTTPEESEEITESLQPTEKTPPEEKRDPAGTGASLTDTNIRVQVSLLDSLMNLAGELVLGRNQLLQAINLRESHNIEAAGQRLDHITSELQEVIMLTRMQPIGNVFSKFPRVVRDLARNLGKQVQLDLEGKNVELDKTIIEAISDPLTHLVRNSVDHGIEGPDVRRKAGKVEMGKITLKAYHEAGQVNIEIIDDGKGMDGDKIARVAASKGLITKDQARVMSEKEKVALIFLPGLSTAEKVTDVSGRGVGMDVVKTNLNKLGGVVDIDSRLGVGTTIRIKLPLTLAIIPSQIISVGGERYAIPQVNLEELLRIPAAEVKERIERVGDAEVVRLRGNLLPLIRLADILGVERTYFDPVKRKGIKERRGMLADRRSKESPQFEDEGTGPTTDEPTGNQTEIQSMDQEANRRSTPDRRYQAGSALNVVVVSNGAFKYGLVVDELFDSEEIVVKPLGTHLKLSKGYAGATIMGDGHVALILDVAGLAQMARLTSVEGTDRALEVAQEQVKSQEDGQSMLIFRNAVDEQFAVPLGLVERIEKIKRADIEQVGGKSVIQYRGKSLPLIAIEEVANVKPQAEGEDVLVIVFLLSGKEVGLLATQPVDAIEGSLELDDTTLRQAGIMGSAIIGDHTTLVIDIFEMVETLNPAWFEKREAVLSSDGSAATILYAEDSEFFRSQVKGYVEDEGYQVIEAEDGMVAWELLQQHSDKISLVITDIEMPNLDGFGLTEKIKKDERFAHIPVIALTTLAGEEDRARGKAVGIDDYQTKLDKDKVRESIHRFLKGDGGAVS